MNNPGLLTGCVAAMFLTIAGGISAHEPQVITLENLFQIAETNSPQLKPSAAAIEVARREVSSARAQRLPDVNASLSLSYIGDGFTTNRSFADYQKAPIPHFGNGLALNVAQPIYAGGAITAGIELAELKLTAARFAAELNRADIRMQLTGFYLDIFKFTNLRDVVVSNIALARKILSDMHTRVEQGTALQNDITRYELLVSNLELSLTQLNNTIQILNTNLVEIAGLPDSTSIVPDPTILDRSLPNGNADYWLTQTRQNSPAIRLAQSSLDISQKAVTLAKAARRPKIGIQAGWNFDGPILTEVPPINRNLSYWFVGLGVTYNISSLFKANKSIAASRAASIKAERDLEVTRQNVELGLRADYVRYLEAFEELKNRQKAVELANNNYSITATRYGADMALITDMLDAANSKLDAEQQLVNARINIIYSYYKLLFISGKI